MQGGFEILPESEPEPECVGGSGGGWAQRDGCVSRFEAVFSRVGAHYVHQCTVGGPAGSLFGPSLMETEKRDVCVGCRREIIIVLVV